MELSVSLNFVRSDMKKMRSKKTTSIILVKLIVGSSSWLSLSGMCFIATLYLLPEVQHRWRFREERARVSISRLLRLEAVANFTTFKISYAARRELLRDRLSVS